MTVHVCPIKDIVCGDRPENWCEGCSKRPAIAAHAQPYDIDAAVKRIFAQTNQRDDSDQDTSPMIRQVKVELLAAHAQARSVAPNSWQVLVNGKWVQADKFEHDLALEEGRTSRALYAATQPEPTAAQAVVQEPVGFLAYQLKKPAYFPTMAELEAGTSSWYPRVSKIVELCAAPQPEPTAAERYSTVQDGGTQVDYVKAQPEPTAAERYSTVQDGGTQVDYVKAQPEPTAAERHNLAAYIAANYPDAEGDTTDEKAINALDKMDAALGMKELPDKPTAPAEMPEFKVAGWLTEHDVGNMLWPDEKEAQTYCDEDFEPAPLVRLSDVQAAWKERS